MEDLGRCIKGGVWGLGFVGVVSPGHLMGVITVMATPDLWERPYFGLLLTPPFFLAPVF